MGTGASAAFDIRRFIEDRLPLSCVPAIPEIRLHLAVASSGLSRLPTKATPYWAYVWAGGSALARYILDCPETVAGKRVLDLGTGSGLVAIAAALAGASKVLAADIDPNALTALTLNTAANGVRVEGVLSDLTAGDPPPVDLIVVGDLFYAEDLALLVMAFLDRCVASGIVGLVGDPGRTSLPRARLDPLADYIVADFGDGGGATTPAAVFRVAPRA